MSRNTKVGNCTVTLTHSRTTNLEEISRSADILIVALGKPEFVTADMVKEGAVIVDVGITRVKSDKSKSKVIIVLMCYYLFICYFLKPPNQPKTTQPYPRSR